MKRVKLGPGVYRVGEYVAFREDHPSIGDQYDRWGNVVAYEASSGSTTWGIVSAELYGRRGDDLGLPDAIVETETLRAAVAWIERH